MLVFPALPANIARFATNFIPSPFPARRQPLTISSRSSSLSATMVAQYPTYKSPYGPKYHYQPNVMGWTPKQMTRFGVKSGAFAGVALFAVIYYASGIPRVQRDILQKIPGLRSYFIKEIPPSDNPF